MSSFPIIPGLMLFFSAVTVGGIGWALARFVPASLVRRRDARVMLHREAVTALAEALSRQQGPEHRARLIANYEAHKAALLALEPGTKVPGFGDGTDARLAA